MAKQYRVNAFVCLNNSITSFLLHLGIDMGRFALLTVDSPLEEYMREVLTHPEFLLQSAQGLDSNFA